MIYKAGFIGCGNMGGALARAASASYRGSIAVCDNDNAKTSLLHNECGAIVSDAVQLIKSSDFVFLGLKPQVMYDAVSPLTDTINSSSFSQSEKGTPTVILTFSVNSEFSIKKPLVSRAY